MPLVTLRLVTIITERVLEERIKRELRTLGARGYTLTNVAGDGQRGVRSTDWEGRNLKIETVVAPEVAERILDHVAERYFEHYAVIAYVQSVDVKRGDKYV
jgi:nitrogen regulatory protein PII